jgi:hypothetical protein
MGSGTEGELGRLRRLIAQADAMLAELRERGTLGDLELARELEGVQRGLQRQLAALLHDDDAPAG